MFEFTRERQIPPQDIEAEKDILALALEDGVLPNVAPEAFYDGSNRLIRTAMDTLASRRVHMDLMTIKDVLEEEFTLEKVGGESALADLVGRMVSHANTEYLADKINDLYNRRSLLFLAAEIQASVYKPSKSTETIAAETQTAVSLLGGQDDGESVLIGDINRDMIDKSLQAIDNPVDTIGIKTGLPKLDKTILGLQGGKLYIVAARPSIGKSALGHNISYRAAFDGEDTLLFSAEMARDEVWRRDVAKITGISTTALKSGRHPSNEERIVDAGALIQNLPLRIYDASHITEQTIARAAMRFRPRLVVIDYLQRMRSSVKEKGRRDLEIGHISWSLKNLATDLDIPVVLLCQLNRKVEGREGKKPILSDLKESGAIEEDADVVIMLWRKDMVLTPGSQFTEAEILIRKNRDGAQCNIKAQFWPFHCEWRESSDY